jgi:hypothetical protein
LTILIDRDLHELSFDSEGESTRDCSIEVCFVSENYRYGPFAVTRRQAGAKPYDPFLRVAHDARCWVVFVARLSE